MNLKKKNTFISLAVPVGVFLLAASSNALALPGDESFKSDVATEDCFFAPAVSSDMNWNYVYADSNAVYQCSSFDLEAGDVLEIKGKYPRARYLSWTYYGTNGGQQLIDVDIQPDAGSENPFINGTQRGIAASDSSYTINIVSGSQPASPIPNTLFNEPFDEASNPFGNFLCSRIYVPDQNTGIFGYTALPTVTLKRGGQTYTGKQMCNAVDALNKGYGLPNKAIGFDADDYVVRRETGFGVGITPPTHPAVNPPKFRAFFNTPHQECLFFTPDLDNGLEPPEGCGSPTLNPDGVGLGNPSSRYVETYVDRGFGEVLVLKGKLPTTPRTWKGNTSVPPVDYQLRYFSICPQESLGTWRVGDCIFDEELAAPGLDENGFYTLVLSRPSFRPTNATEECGYSWTTPPPAGDGLGDIFLYNIWTRFMLPSPNFAETAQNVMVPGEESEVMKEYLPQGEYMSVEEFEALGCSI